jgi:hypothetical protein
VGDVNGDTALLFSYDGLGRITATYTGNAIALSGMLAKLEAAEAAEARGNLAGKAMALQKYRNKVKAERGRSLTRAEANTLLAISKTL